MGSYTGEVSGEALKSLGVKYVFINHSERRHLNNEPLELAKEKLIRAKEADLIPILCVGEEDDEDAVEVLTHDLNYLLKDLNIDNLYISYEPCYAIGSGNIPSREKLVTVFNYLKENYNDLVCEVFNEIALYYTTMDRYFYLLAPYLVDITLIAIIILLYKTLSFVNIASGTEKATTYADRFYDEL